MTDYSTWVQRGSPNVRVRRTPWYAQWVRFLGVDYGRKRIGLAVSDATGMLARPWKTIAPMGAAESVAAALAAEINLLREEPEGIGGVILGFPRRLSGEPNEQTSIVETVAARLRTLVADVPVVLQDERLTSHAAETLLARREKDWRKRKLLLDAVSAAVILQDYLDTQK